MSNYLKFRGKCKELSENEIKKDPTLILIRGHYICQFLGSQEHWWLKKPDGTIYDPSAKQFPSGGMGEYIEFDGIVPCSNCGKEMEEESVKYKDGRFCFCSYKCQGSFIGVVMNGGQA